MDAEICVEESSELSGGWVGDSGSKLDAPDDSAIGCDRLKNPPPPPYRDPTSVTLRFRLLRVSI